MKTILLVLLLAGCGEIPDDDDNITPARWPKLEAMCIGHGGLERGYIKGKNYKSKPFIEGNMHSTCKDGAWVTLPLKEPK